MLGLASGTTSQPCMHKSFLPDEEDEEENGKEQTADGYPTPDVSDVG